MGSLWLCEPLVIYPYFSIRKVCISMCQTVRLYSQWPTRIYCFPRPRCNFCLCLLPRPAYLTCWSIIECYFIVQFLNYTTCFFFSLQVIIVIVSYFRTDVKCTITFIRIVYYCYVTFIRNKCSVSVCENQRKMCTSEK